MEISIYRALWSDGSTTYVGRLGASSRVAPEADSVAILASQIFNCRVKYMLPLSESSDGMHIVFQQHLTIEWPAGLRPRTCMPLAQSEQEEFIKSFFDQIPK